MRRSLRANWAGGTLPPCAANGKGTAEADRAQLEKLFLSLA